MIKKTKGSGATKPVTKFTPDEEVRKQLVEASEKLALYEREMRDFCKWSKTVLARPMRMLTFEKFVDGIK